MTVQVVVVDDDPMVMQGLARAFGPGGSHREDVLILGATTAAEDAAALVADLQPEVVLINNAMPAPGGLVAIRDTKKRCPSVMIGCLSSSLDVDYQLAAIHAGADGFINKTADPALLIPPIRALAVGYTVIPAALRREMLLIPARGGQEDHIAHLRVLDPVVRSILPLLAQGMSDKQIEATRHLSRSTVQRYVRVLRLRLGINRRDQASLNYWARLYEQEFDSSEVP